MHCLGVTFKLAPHMNLRHELVAHRDSERLHAELNEPAMLIEALRGRISMRDGELHKLDVVTTPGVLKCCQDKLTADATLSELRRHIHTEQCCFVVCLLTCFERKASDANELVFVKCSQNYFGCLGCFT